MGFSGSHVYGGTRPLLSVYDVVGAMALARREKLNLNIRFAVVNIVRIVSLVGVQARAKEEKCNLVINTKVYCIVNLATSFWPPKSMR